MFLTVKEIRKHFGEGDSRVEVLNGIDAEIEKGEICVLLGPSGSGKSTLLKSMLGLLRPLSGEIRLDENLRRGAIGYLPQQTRAQKDFPATVSEVVLSGFLSARGWKFFYTPAQKSQALQHMGKLGILELKDKLGMAIIMITHDLGIVASMCDRIAVMYAGRIVETGTCDEIFYHPKHEYTKGLLESIPRLDSTKHEKLIPIEGNPVDLLNPPEGCAFAPRCKNCMKICLRENPPKTDFSETHYAHCFMNQKAEMEGGNTNE